MNISIEKGSTVKKTISMKIRIEMTDDRIYDEWIKN